jgi:hypothetical protein
MKNSPHYSCYKPGHGRKHGIKVYVAYSAALHGWHGAVWQRAPTTVLYTTGICVSETDAHAALQQWLREHRYHKAKPHAPPGATGA